MAERFVKMLGVIEIHWTSDDPEYSHPSSDLFDEQEKGIPDWWGPQ